MRRRSVLLAMAACLLVLVGEDTTRAGFLHPEEMVSFEILAWDEFSVGEGLAGQPFEWGDRASFLPASRADVTSWAGSRNH